MMKTPLDDLNFAPPVPDGEARNRAWDLAVCEFGREPAAKFGRVGRLRWLVAIAAVLAVLVALMGLFREADDKPVIADEEGHTYEIFEEGVALFGNRLRAVTVSESGVTWHLSESGSGVVSPQLIRVSLLNEEEIVARAGEVVPISFHGKTYHVEFLEDSEGNIVGMGEDVFWQGIGENSPIVTAQVELSIP